MDPQSPDPIPDPDHDSHPETKWHQGSPMLRSFGIALLSVGVAGLVFMGLLYLASSNDAIFVAVPVMVVFVLIGGMLMLQSRRPKQR